MHLCVLLRILRLLFSRQAKPYLESRNIKEIADPKLGDNYDTEEMERAMAIASMCIHHTPSNRPFMNEVTIFSSILFLPKLCINPL